MIEYRLDPKNPRQLTPEEARRLDEAEIDYSDIPEIGNEDRTIMVRHALKDRKP
jgi:hypothetical protein